jgi:hypothetical protein
VKSVARCAQDRNLTKCQRGSSGEQIKEGKLGRESGGNFQGKETAKFLVEVSECKIFSQKEKNDSRPFDLVELHGG